MVRLLSFTILSIKRKNIETFFGPAWKRRITVLEPPDFDNFVSFVTSRDMSTTYEKPYIKPQHAVHLALT
jgi:hypothetical protein